MGDGEGESWEEFPADASSYQEDCRQEGKERGRKEGRTRTHRESKRVRADSDYKAPVLLGSCPRPSLAAKDLNNDRSGIIKKWIREGPVFWRFGLKGKLICNMTDLELKAGQCLPNCHGFLNQAWTSRKIVPLLGANRGGLAWWPCRERVR